jgi:hypothetical protein
MDHEIGRRSPRLPEQSEDPTIRAQVRRGSIGREAVQADRDRAADVIGYFWQMVGTRSGRWRSPGFIADNFRTLKS